MCCGITTSCRGSKNKHLNKDKSKDDGLKRKRKYSRNRWFLWTGRKREGGWIFERRQGRTEIKLIFNVSVLGFSFSRGQHIVKRIVTYTLSQPFHPIVFFVVAAGRHPINGVFAFDHFALRVRFASFDEIGPAARVKFKTMLLLAVGTFPHRYIFQRDNATGLFIRRVLEIIQTVIVEDKPAALPALVSPPLFPQPSFFVGIEKGVHQVVAVVLGYFERFRFYTFVKTLKKYSILYIYS